MPVSDLENSFTFTSMKNNHNTPLSHLGENSLLSGAPLENTLGWSPWKIEDIITRWNLVKKEEVLGNMDQILELSRQSEVFFEKNNSIYKKMEHLLFTLREWRWRKWYWRAIGIIAKYLQWIERFLAGWKAREIDFYKKLFEGTMIAILEEVKNLRSALS